MSLVRTLLDSFAEARTAGPYAYEWHHHHAGGQHPFHVVIGAVVHGNEVGSLPAILELIAGLADGSTKFGGKLTIFLGNPEASLADTRFLEADLNRVFISEPPDNHEGRRARQLKPILDAADLFLDLHQTILQTDRAFYIFPFSEESWLWARATAAATTWVTRPPAASFSSGTCCADEYVRNRNRPGLTLELGQKGVNAQATERARAALHRLLHLADQVGPDPARLRPAALAHPELTFLQTAWRQRFDHSRRKLRDGLTNFQRVTAGDVLSAPGTPLIEAPHDGLLLFPKYPTYADNGEVIEPRPGEIVGIVEPMTQHPTLVWPTHDA